MLRFLPTVATTNGRKKPHWNNDRKLHYSAPQWSLWQEVWRGVSNDANQPSKSTRVEAYQIHWVGLYLQRLSTGLMQTDRQTHTWLLFAKAGWCGWIWWIFERFPPDFPKVHLIPPYRSAHSLVPRAKQWTPTERSRKMWSDCTGTVCCKDLDLLTLAKINAVWNCKYGGSPELLQCDHYQCRTCLPHRTLLPSTACFTWCLYLIPKSVIKMK